MARTSSIGTSSRATSSSRGRQGRRARLPLGLRSHEAEGLRDPDPHRRDRRVRRLRSTRADRRSPARRPCRCLLAGLRAVRVHDRARAIRAGLGYRDALGARPGGRAERVPDRSCEVAPYDPVLAAGMAKDVALRTREAGELMAAAASVLATTEHAEPGPSSAIRGAAPEALRRLAGDAAADPRRRRRRSPLDRCRGLGRDRGHRRPRRRGHRSITRGRPRPRRPRRRPRPATSNSTVERRASDSWRRSATGRTGRWSSCCRASAMPRSSGPRSIAVRPVTSTRAPR